MYDNAVPEALTVRDLLIRAPICVPPSTPIQEAIRLMNQNRIGAVLVANGRELLGIFTERDLLKMASEMAVGWRQLPVGEWMTPNPQAISPDTGWEAAMAIMDRFHFRHLPVVEDGKVVGIVSSRQLMGQRTEQLNHMVEQRTHDLMERDRQIQYQLQVAGRLLNRAMLPKAPAGCADLDWAVKYAPLDQLGGDYYDFVAPDDRYVGVLIADAAGHSVAAAMVAVMARIAFAEVVRETTQPAEVLRGMNTRLLGLTEERFVTAFFGLFDRQTRTLTCASAGHPPALLYSARDRACHEFGPKALMLGITDDVDFSEQTIALHPGDRLCLYTDGVIESTNADSVQFGADRLKAHVHEHSKLSANELLRKINHALNDHRGDHPLGDDVTILVAAAS